MSEEFMEVPAYQVKPGDVVNLFEGPKQVKAVRDMRDATVKLSFYDGTWLKIVRLAEVPIQKVEKS